MANYSDTAKHNILINAQCATTGYWEDRVLDQNNGLKGCDNTDMRYLIYAIEVAKCLHYEDSEITDYWVSEIEVLSPTTSCGGSPADDNLTWDGEMIINSTEIIAFTPTVITNANDPIGTILEYFVTELNSDWNAVFTASVDPDDPHIINVYACDEKYSGSTIEIKIHVDGWVNCTVLNVNDWVWDAGNTYADYGKEFTFTPSTHEIQNCLTDAEQNQLFENIKSLTNICCN